MVCLIENRADSLVDQIIRYEEGGMPDDEMIDFFQGIIDSGMAWSLQGHYGRTAQMLIEMGVCHMGR